MSSSEVVVVGIGGSMRPGSSTEMAVRAVLGAAAARGAVVTMFAGQTCNCRHTSLGLWTPGADGCSTR